MSLPPLDQLLTLAEAARALPRRSNGKPVHIASLYRWSRDGCHGVRLATVQVGHQRYTTEAALAEFIQQVTDRTREAPCSASRTTRRKEEVRAADEAAATALGSRPGEE